MNKWKVYILECNDGSLYTGITIDLPKRLNKHNKGLASKYTRAKRPVSVVYTEDAANASSAKKREAEIKKLSRQEKLELIK
ncbi:MAG: GIY-YIG nuclease family protein [Candidatus Omnitrophica bacterium]|nr:GIY-YIG nuclease family protein [Candidatus Omnitrophota bacterium]